MTLPTSRMQAVSRIQNAIGYDFRHAPNLLFALGDRQESLGVPTAAPVDTLQTIYLQLMGIKGRRPSDDDLAACGNRVGIADYVCNLDRRSTEDRNIADFMKAVLGAIWMDCGSALEVARISKGLGLGDTFGL
ncbi:hypothetical protein GQ44DRAFT_732920 [Phaeosphaeriaceae sp. PMI808]|nr:hypothetical protein GQ44DRAFT_732920 [Phaeosphaeriaceae sp. PMI808]